MLILEHSFVKVLEQMSMINFINCPLSTAAEGFVPSHAPLKNNQHLNIPFLSTQPRRGKNKSESQGLTPSSWVCALGKKRGCWGHASILSAMTNAAPNMTLCNPMVCSTQGFSVHHQLPELAEIEVHRIPNAIQPSHPLSSPSPLAFIPSQHQHLSQWVSSLHHVDKVLEFQLQRQSF